MPTQASESPRIGERVRNVVWVVPIVLALAELLAHVTMRTRVPERDDWRRAASYVGTRLGPRDHVLAAPSWADPLLREQLGNQLGLERSGSLDLEMWDRVWVVAQRGHLPPGLVGHVPTSTRRFGALGVARYDLGKSPLVYDFVAHWADAEASLVENGLERPCRRTQSPPRGGGLGQGTYWPSDRMSCDPQRPWLWFGPTVNEDLDLALRQCLFQHPSGPEPFRVVYREVPLGERLVVDADIYYENERQEMHGFTPFELRVLIDGRDVGTMRHVDGQGRKRMVIATAPEGGDPTRRATVTFEVTSVDPHFRPVCWTGSTRGAPREERTP